MLPKRQGGHPGETLIILELPRLITVDRLGYCKVELLREQTSEYMQKGAT